MSGTQLLRLLVNERLAAAAEEIFGLVEKSIAEYQAEAVRSKREIIQLKQQIEQLSVLKPQVILSRADTQLVSGETLPSQQPDQFPSVEEKATHDSQRVKEEQVDWCISTDMGADTSIHSEFRHPKSEPDTNCELLPSSTPETESVNESIDEEWNERDGSLTPHQQVDQCIISNMRDDPSEYVNARLAESETTAQADYQQFPTFNTITVTLNDDELNGSAGFGSSSSAPSCSDTAFREQEQAQKDKKACHFCGKCFNRESFLIRHIDKIHMNVAFKCSECDKQFTNRGHLAAHLRIHTGEKPFRCSFCTKSFAQSSNLNVHLRMHTGEKPYFCKSCGKMVARSNHLKTCGMRNLKGNKSFCCLVCGKKFHTASKLQVHKKIHEARKPHTLL